MVSPDSWSSSSARRRPSRGSGDGAGSGGVDVVAAAAAVGGGDAVGSRNAADPAGRLDGVGATAAAVVGGGGGRRRPPAETQACFLHFLPLRLESFPDCGFAFSFGARRSDAVVAAVARGAGGGDACDGGTEG